MMAEPDRGMTGAQIQSYLEKFCPPFSLAGISSIDNLKNVKLQEDQAIVVNTGAQFMNWNQRQNVPKLTKNFSILRVLNVLDLKLLNCAPGLSTGSGLHWICACRCRGASQIGECTDGSSHSCPLEVYDSLGCSQYFVLKHFGHLSQHFIFLNVPTMPISETLCGQFVCYFLTERQSNIDLDFEVRNSQILLNISGILFMGHTFNMHEYL